MSSTQVDRVRQASQTPASAGIAGTGCRETFSMICARISDIFGHGGLTITKHDVISEKGISKGYRDGRLKNGCNNGCTS